MSAESNISAEELRIAKLSNEEIVRECIGLSRGSTDPLHQLLTEELERRGLSR